MKFGVRATLEEPHPLARALSLRLLTTTYNAILHHISTPLESRDIERC